MTVTFSELYAPDQLSTQKSRYQALKERFFAQYGFRDDLQFFSAPGRTEIGGNHTDHNHGRVLAAAVTLDIIVAAVKTDTPMIQLKSAEYPSLDTVNLNDLSVSEDEKGTSLALIKGVCARCKALGYQIGGFNAYTMTNVLKGSGLSSSAAFEVALVTVISHLFNGGKIDSVEAACIAQYAENVYFGKPSGLMDQMASSVGGVISIDFKNPENPVINRIPFDLSTYELALCVVDTGGNHADLTDEYAAIPREMKAVAAHFGKKVLREVKVEQVKKELAALRQKVGDRAILRSLHFFSDDQTAEAEAQALQNGDIASFLALVNRSGLSSETRLQNVFAIIQPQEQGPSLALALTREILNGRGACRVHGGGFAGTIQAFVPLDLLKDYVSQMEQVFGDESCYVLSFRKAGGVKVGEI